MRHPLILKLILSAFWLALICPPVWSADPVKPIAPSTAPPAATESADLHKLQRLYVPVADLKAVLKQESLTVVMPLEEFEDKLQTTLSASPENPSGSPIATSAGYRLTMKPDQILAEIDVQVTASQKKSGLELRTAGWNVLSATLDDQPAALHRSADDSQRLSVLIETAGDHHLHLTAATPLKSTGTEKHASFGVLSAAAVQLQIELPAGQSLKVNGRDPGRPAAVDQPAKYRLALGGRDHVELTMSQRQASSRSDELTFARTAFGLHVQPGEITWTARTELQVLGQQLEQLVCQLPKNVELTRVESAELEAWDLSEVKDHPDRQQLTLRFRRPIEGEHAISLQGIFAAAPEQPWNVPTLIFSNVSAQTGGVLIRYPENVRLRNLKVAGARTLARYREPQGAHPSGAEPWIYQVWRPDFELQFVTTLKKQLLQAAMTNLLSIGDDGVELSLALSLETRQAPLFTGRIQLPAEYEVESLTADNRPVAWEVLSEEAGVNEVRFPIDPPLQPGQTKSISLQAQAHPEGWPLQSQTVTIALPEVRLPQATMVEAQYGILAPDSLELVPLDLTGLDPAGRKSLDQLNAKLQQSGRQVRLGFTYQDTVFKGQLQISRKPTLFIAETVTFFRVDRETVFTRWESQLSFSGGGIRTLEPYLSAAAGEQLRFQLIPLTDSAVPAQIVEQLPGEVANERRPWKLTCDRYLHGSYLLTAEVQQPRGDATTFSPPALRFPQANAESGYLAIEGRPDQQVEIVAQAADGQPLATIDPVDLPQGHHPSGGRIVAGFRSLGPDWTCTVTPTQFERAALPSAIGHAAKMTSAWSDGGDFQHHAEIRFSAVGMQGLLIKLPGDADLWSILLDQMPVEARQTEQGFQVPLSGADPAREHHLQVLYRTPPPPRQRAGELRAEPPRFSVLSGQGEEQPLQLLAQSWELHSPPNALLTESKGAFRPEVPLRSHTALGRLRESLTMPETTQFWQSLIALSVLFCVGAVLIWLIGKSSREVRFPSLGFWLTLSVVVLFFGSLIVPGVYNAREASDRRPSIGMSAVQMQMIPMAAPTEPPAAAASPSKAVSDEFGTQTNQKSELSAGAKKRALDGKPGLPPPAAPKPSPFQDSNGTIPGDLLEAASPARAETRPAQSTRASEGLLSMSFNLQIPEDAQTTRFEYAGNRAGTQTQALQVHYADRTTFQLRIWCLAVGIALFGWWLRRASLCVKRGWLFLTLVIPLAAWGLVTPQWLGVVEGLLFGGLASLAGWGLIACCSCCCSLVEKPFASWWRACCPGLGLLILLTSTGGSLRADESASKPVPPTPHVVIPYRSAKELTQAGSVWMTQTLFDQLQRSGKPAAIPFAGGVKSSVSQARYEAKLVPRDGRYRVEVQIEWEIANFTDQPQVVPLPLKNSHLQQATRQDRPALLVSTKDHGLGVVVPPQELSLVKSSLVLPQLVDAVAGEFVLDLLPVAAGQLTLQMPATQQGRTLRVNQVSGDWQKTTTEDGSRFLIPVAHGGRTQIAWNSSAEQGPGQQLVQLETAVDVEVDEVGLQVRHGFQIQVRHGELQELSFEIPESFVIRHVAGPEVGSWKIVKNEKQQLLQVSFNQLLRKTGSLQVDLFQPHQWTEEAQTVSIGLLKPLGVERENGQLAIRTGEQLSVRVQQAESLQQIDVSHFHPIAASTASNVPLQQAYQFFSRPVEAKLEVARRDAEVRAVAEHGVEVNRRKVLIASRLRITLAGAPRRLVEIQLPDGYLPMDVVCERARDWYVVEHEGQPVLTIELDQPMTGEFEIGLEGQIVKNPADASIQVRVPQVLKTARSRSQIGIWFDESYQAALSNRGNWRSLPTGNLPPGTQQLRNRPAQFAFETAEPVGALEFQVQRPVPELTADAGVLIAVGDATVDYGLTLRWKITNAAADQLVFTVPGWLGTLEFKGVGIRQAQSQAIDANRTRWSVSLIDPVRDQFLLTAAATVGSPADQLIKTPRVEFESQSPTGVVSPLAVQQQFAVLVNLSRNQLVPADLNHFESVTADELPLTMPTELMQQAMEIVRVRTEKIPAWKIQQMQSAIGGHAIVSTVTLTTVLQMDGSWRTEAIYGVRNRGQQFLALKLPEKSRVLSVFVREEAARTVLTQLQNQPIHLIALPQTSAADLSFDVSILLEGELAQRLPESFNLRGIQIQLPVPRVVSSQESADFGLTVAHTLWNVFLPDEVLAVPVRQRGSTNMAFHQQAGWLSVELQSLDRVRADIAELKRLGSDQRVSRDQQQQALKNLTELNLQLQQRSTGSDSTWNYLSTSERGAAKARSEQQQAVSEAEAALLELNALVRREESKDFNRAGSGMNQPGSEQYGNRAYIMKNNSAISSVNGLPLKPSATDASSENFNFYRADDRRRSGASGKSEAPQERAIRSRLKEQLQQQAPTLQMQDAQAKPSSTLGFSLPSPGAKDDAILSEKSDSFLGMPRNLQRGEVPALQAEEMAGAMGGMGGGIGIGQRVVVPQISQTAVENPVPDVKTTGLSVAMALPERGVELSFDKSGGDPQLRLAIRPRQTWWHIGGFFWGVFCLCVGISVLRSMRRNRPASVLVGRLGLFVLIASAIGYLLLPNELRDGVLWLYFLCGIVMIASSIVGAVRAAD